MKWQWWRTPRQENESFEQDKQRLKKANDDAERVNTLNEHHAWIRQENRFGPTVLAVFEKHHKGGTR